MKPSFKSVFQKNLQSSVLISDIVLTLMMACVTYGVIQVGQAAFDAWNLIHLMWISMLITLEALYSRRIAKSLGGTEEIVYRVSEIIVLALIIKLILYILKGGIIQLLADIPSWQENFLNFFSSEYLLALIFIFTIWLLSTTIGNNLDKLHNLEENITWDTLSIFQKDFQATHSSLLLQVMLIGLVVLLLAIFTHLVITFENQIQLTYIPSTAPVLNVLAYFFLALILLSQSQLAALRTRWWLDKIKISTRISSNWLISAVIFFAFLAILAFILPTGYSIGFLDTLRLIVNYLLIAARFIFYLILLPFYLIASLFGVERAAAPPPSQEPLPPMQTPPSPEAAPAPEWFQVLKSFLFWGTLLLVVGYAIWQYFQHNEKILEFLNKFSLFAFLRSIFEKIRQWLKGMNDNITTFVRQSIESIRKTSKRRTTPREGRRINFRQLSAQEKVIFLYMEFTKLGMRHGILRKIFHTPYQYEKIAETSLPNVSQDIHIITEVFVDARYSGHAISEAQSQIMKEEIKKISREIHELEQQKTKGETRPEDN